jgi:hypothetical protein
MWTSNLANGSTGQGMGMDKAGSEDLKEEPAIRLDDVPLLVRSAFDSARAGGKTEWRRMTTAVLKNRLLQMTERRFDEKVLGFATVSALLAEFPDLVQLDQMTRPTTVEFVAEETRDQADLAETRPQDRLRDRVRPDLWRAILDYSAGHEWVWDARTARVRQSEPDDDSTRVLPTITREEFASLRATFVDKVGGGLDPTDKDRVERWRERGLGTAALPPQLQGQWNEQLKSEVIDRLTRWFVQQGVSVPDDLVGVEYSRALRKTDEELTRLRSLVIECVQSMTVSELASLVLPAGVVLRVQSRRRRTS